MGVFVVNGSPSAVQLFLTSAEDYRNAGFVVFTLNNSYFDQI